MPSIATDRYVDRTEMEEFVRPRHRGVLLTTRRDGRPQSSLVTLGLDTSGRVVVSSYPERAKSINAKRSPAASMVVMSDEFGGEWIQLDGTAEVLDMPEALDGLVEYFRVISGEHPDWDEYREAMAHQGKCLIRLTIDQWGPISKGGFPARLVEDS
ncbi:PPOX class F420-dependent oxidoreductase [Candidatus Poriferisocius sp.]|uniref:PPOX class F420-dependent oxidoreductase n=1 Tax=Candidatus Poriferisocius sp. TaxID=3101276 RepID=UPI003B028414